MDLAAFRLQDARLVRIGEESDRLVGLDQHDMLEILQDRQRQIDRIRNPVDREAAAAARHARMIGLAHHPAAGLARDLLGERKALRGQAGPGDQHQCLRAIVLEYLGRLLDRLRRIARALAVGGNLGNAVGLVPGGIGGQDQRRDLGRSALGRGNRGGAIGRHRLGVRRGANPGRHRPRQTLDIRGQRCVVTDVVGRVLTDDVNDARMRLLGVVQVGKAVGEAGTKMQQGRGRRALHAEIAVRGSGHHALEQAEHAAHAGDPVQCGDEMHLRGARIAKADVNTARYQRPHQTFRTVHRFNSIGEIDFLRPDLINHS